MQVLYLLPLTMNVLPKPKPDKEFVKFCNSLRCPLCGSQLDGNIHPNQALLYCVEDNTEYRCWCHHNEPYPHTETLLYRFPTYEYEVNIYWDGSDVFNTVITRYNSDVAKRYRDSTRMLMLDYKGSRIFLLPKKLDEKAFLKKLKLYITFS